MEVGCSFASNLQELYQMEVDSEGKAHQMLPALFGHGLYYSEMGWGVVLKVIYAVCAFFFGREFIVANMRRALEKTAIDYRIHRCELGYHFREYQKQLTFALENSEQFDAVSYEKSRYSIVVWSDATRPFNKLFAAKSAEKIDTLFRWYMGDDYAEEGLLFNEEKLPEGYREELGVINFFRKFERALPFALLSKIIRNSEISDEEGEELASWIEEMNERSEELSVEKFHRHLRTIVRKVVGVKSGEDRVVEGVELLELELIKRGLRLFEQDDKKQLEWVESLKEGQLIEVNNGRFFLGKEVEGKKGSGNRYRVFTVQNHIETMFIFGKNRAILGIRRRAALKYSWALQSNYWRRIAPDGSCAIVSRLPEGLEGRQWESREKEFLFKEIRDLFPFVQLIRRFIAEDLTPENLQLSHFRYNRLSQLVSTKPLIKGTFDFARLVALCKSCAGGNRTIYNYLIEESGLAEVAKSRLYDEFFEGVVERTILGEKFDTSDYAAVTRYKIVNYHIIQAAEELKREVASMHERCMRRVSSRNPIALSKKIGQAILEKYRLDRSFSTLWPEAEEWVVEKMNIAQK